ncbi:6932_t:CDS:2, partial [Dentiscutata erythropus]
MNEEIYNNNMKNDDNSDIGNEKPLSEYSKKLETYLKSHDIKCFNYSECNNLKRIGQGGFATVYSAYFQKREYALKSLNNNLCLDDDSFKRLRNEIINNERERNIENTPSDYVDVYSKCWSSEPSQRLTLREILDKLEKLSTYSKTEFITNEINHSPREQTSTEKLFEGNKHTSLKETKNVCFSTPTIETTYWKIEKDNKNFVEYDSMKNILNGSDEFQIVDDDIKPFIPLINKVTEIANQMQIIQENAKCYNKTCLALLDRIDITQTAVKCLQRNRRTYNLYRKQDYYDNWVRLINVLENIKKFAEEITQMSCFQVYKNNLDEIKIHYDKNIEQLESVCKDLSLNSVIYDITQKENEIQDVIDDIDLAKKFQSELQHELRPEIMPLVCALMEQYTSSTSDTDIAFVMEEFKAPKIDPKDLTKPLSKKDNVRGANGNVIKKLYRGIEVACKKSQHDETWNDEPSARPNDLEMQINLKNIYDKHAGISPDISFKNPNSSISQRKNNIDSQKIEQCETSDKPALKRQPKAIELLEKIKMKKGKF